MTSGTVSPSEPYDCVLIDDDEMIRAAWRIAAKRAGQRLLVLESGPAFFSHTSQLNRSIPIYVDYSMLHQPNGDKLIEHLYASGFTNLYIETGYEDLDVDPETRSLLRGVIGKTPPWVKI
jgi:hypothetical protein